jgi:hypothetical protein
MSAVKRFIATTDFQRTTGLPIQGKSEKLPNLPSLGRFFVHAGMICHQAKGRSCVSSGT